MKRRLCALLILLYVLPAAALVPRLSDLDELPLHTVPDVVSAKAVEQARAVKGAGPYLFAANVDLPVSLDMGIWERGGDGRAHWRTRVFSADATLIVLEFARFRVPQGAELWIYDAQGRAVHGPYTAAHQTAEGTLWTPWVPGDTAVIELIVDEARRGQIELQLGRLGHGFRNARDLGTSGSCNIDAACSQGNNWRNEIRSVVKLQIPAGPFVGVCSGTLVNNLRRDGRPYVLTADHCGIGALGSPASGVISYWNFLNSRCGGADDASAAQTITGTTLRADDRATDLTLIELSQVPPASFDAYYAGWDAGGGGGSSGIGIHHPSGDARKISVFTQTLQAGNVQIEALGPSIPAWRVPSWSQGVTEPGSSGSGLWNQDHRIVGVLSGGASACDGNVGNGLDDYYARLDRQWQARSTTSGQLKAWLDPDDTGQTRVDGRNAGSAPASGSDVGSEQSSGGGGGSPAPALLWVLLGAAGLRRLRACESIPRRREGGPGRVRRGVGRRKLRA